MAFKAARKAARQDPQRGSCIEQVPVHLIIARRSNGTGGISLADARAELATLNPWFAGACIAFCDCHVTYVDDDNYYDFEQSTDENPLFTNYAYPDILNVLFADQVANSGGAAVGGYAYLPNGRPIHCSRLQYHDEWRGISARN